MNPAMKILESLIQTAYERTLQRDAGETSVTTLFKKFDGAIPRLQSCFRAAVPIRSPSPDLWRQRALRITLPHNWLGLCALSGRAETAFSAAAHANLRGLQI